ncbi:hypothetical protein HDU98_000144 [Podochytrium sp. JEL0797]|nr:hypothetical protein HDU98_000144 [Podochytrium sp. JEL0797]
MTVGSLFSQLLFRSHWTPSSLPDLTGKVALITGATSGLGFEIARQLVSQQCTVVIVARSHEKGVEAVASLQDLTACDVSRIGFVVADLQDMHQIQTLVKEFLQLHDSLHILIHAAIASTTGPFQLSKHGIERQFQVNHFSRMLLTHLLLPVLERSQPSRIVNLTSMAHMFVLGGIDYQMFDVEEAYNADTRYNETMLATVHFTRGLQDRLELKYTEMGKECRVFVNCVHPGAVNTSEKPQDLTNRLLNSLKVDVEKGAITPLYVAAAPEVEEVGMKGAYFVPHCKVTMPSAVAQDRVKATTTWLWSEYVFRHYFEPEFEMGV